MPNPIFKPYQQNQMCLLPPDLNDMIPKDHLVRVVDSIVESINLSPIKKAYAGGGAPSYDPKMMLKVIVYAYASGIYSSRKISAATHENIYFLWLTGQNPLDHMTINRFRSKRLSDAFEKIFSEVIFLIAKSGYITLETYFLDGTKIEATSNKYSFVWKGSVDSFQEKLRQKVKSHLEEIDRINEEEDRIAEVLPEKEEISAEDIQNVADRINARLKKDPKDKELKKAAKAFTKDYIPRMRRYENQQKLFDNRRSFSKTDTDATFMRMKEDHMGNGQLKAGYNVQIGTENQFVVGYSLHRRPGDTACMVEHLEKLKQQIGHIPNRIIADAGYGSEENYAYLESQDVEAFVKHAMFHKTQKRSFRNDPLNSANWTYSEQEDSYTCAGNKKLIFMREKVTKSDLGYKSTVRMYGCQDCSECIYCKKCPKARRRIIYISPSREAYRNRASKLLTSAEGVDLRRRRATDVETVFGNIKNNFHFKRFSVRGLKNVTLEWGLVAFGHNMRKLCQQMA